MTDTATMNAVADAAYLAARATFDAALDAVDGKAITDASDATYRAAYEVYAAARKTYLGR